MSSLLHFFSRKSNIIRIKCSILKDRKYKKCINFDAMILAWQIVKGTTDHDNYNYHCIKIYTFLIFSIFENWAFYPDYIWLSGKKMKKWIFQSERETTEYFSVKGRNQTYLFHQPFWATSIISFHAQVCFNFNNYYANIIIYV